MKNSSFMIVLTLLVTLLSTDETFAQRPGDDSKFEIGFGQAYIPIAKWVRFTPVISFNYKINKCALRAGLSCTGRDISSLSTYHILGNLGYERRFFGQKANLITGIDFCYLHRYSESIWNPDTVKDYSQIFYHWGAGPVIGCVYNINKNLSLRTELGLYYGYGGLRQNFNGVTISEQRNKGTYLTKHRLFSLQLYYNLGRALKK